MKNIIKKLKKQNIISLLEIKNNDCAKIEYIEKYKNEFNEFYENFVSYKQLNDNIIDYDRLFKEIKKNIFSICDNIININVENDTILIREIIKQLNLINNNNFYNKSNFIIINSKYLDVIDIYLSNINIIVDNSLNDTFIIGKTIFLPNPGTILLYNIEKKIYKIVNIGSDYKNHYCILKYNN